MQNQLIVFLGARRPETRPRAAGDENFGRNASTVEILVEIQQRDLFTVLADLILLH